MRSEPHSCWEKGVLGKETAGWEALEWELAYEMREATVDKAGGGGQILEGHIEGFEQSGMIFFCLFLMYNSVICSIFGRICSHHHRQL